MVIAIIALLVSLLMPSLAKARDLAKEVTCSTSQRALLTGWHMYASDNDGCIMRAQHGVYNPDESTMWFKVMPQYATGSQTLKTWHHLVQLPACPVDDGGYSPWLGMNEQLDPWVTANGTNTIGMSGLQLPPSLSLESFTRSQDTCVFQEAIWEIYYINPGTPTSYNSMVNRHRDNTASTIGFADGHVSVYVTAVDGFSFPPEDVIYDPRTNELGHPSWSY